MKDFQLSIGKYILGGEEEETSSLANIIMIDKNIIYLWATLRSINLFLNIQFLFCGEPLIIFFVVFSFTITECKFGLVNGGEKLIYPNGGRPLDTTRQSGEKHWYESVTDPLFEDSRTFGGVPSIKEGQLPNELPTRNYFRHHHRNLDKIVGSARFHSKDTLLVPPLQSTASVIENSNRNPNNKKSSRELSEQHQLTDQASIQQWLNTNGYKLSDFGLADKTSAATDEIPVFESSDGNQSEDITKSYTNNVLSKLGLSSEQATVTSSLTGTPLKQLAMGSSNRKEKVSKKKQPTKHNKPDQYHRKKTTANTSRRLAKIVNLISLLKDYSSLQQHNKQTTSSGKPTTKHSSSHHHQRQIPSVIPRHEELITSSEQVQEDETAASDKEAKMKGELIRISTQSNLDGDYHKSLKTTPLRSPSSSNSPHHLVTVDTTTGKVYAERMIPHDDFDELGLMLTGGTKKTSLGFIPQHNKAENGIRRVKTPVEPLKNKLTSPKKKQESTKASSRETLLKRISKELSSISTDKLKRLDNTLGKLKRLRKKH